MRNLISIPSPMPSSPLVENLKKYFLLGGLPETVARWVNERDSGQIDSILYSIIQAYERDFAKHPEPREYPKLMQIWHSLPSQLARENKKFFYQLVREGARAREYEDALHWLVRQRWSRKSPAAPNLHRLCQPMRNCPPSSCTQPMWRCSGGWRSLIIPRSFTPHACLPSLRERVPRRT